ncbi:hypothetical protein PORY_001405 [Pneumocystis oryctolagi]|uniref:Uncharacterized protein n=1 Tax=Pneumocystis oryctolagi TaxID=42067 RepID=A0ACB7CCX3_9ASCO|nr:hypothetical protein PORY_001405 [Pneumocystis oryctolagi]
MQHDEETFFFNRKLSSFKHTQPFANEKYHSKKSNPNSFYPVQVSSSEAFSSDQNVSSSQENSSDSSVKLLTSPKVTSNTKKKDQKNQKILNISTQTLHKDTKKKATKSHSTPESSPLQKRSSSLTPPPRLSKQVIQEGRRMRLTQETKINKKSIKETISSEKEHDFCTHKDINIEIYDKQNINEKNTDSVNQIITKSVNDRSSLKVFEVTVIGKQNVETDTSNFFPETWEEPVLFKIYENQPFKIMKNAFCSHKKLPKSRYNQIVLVFRKKKVFESATPKGIGMLKYSPRITIEVMSTTAYEHLMNEIERKKKIQNKNAFDFFDLTKEESESTSLAIIDKSPLELVLRNENNESLKLSTNSNTTVSELINAFRISKNIDTNTNVTLKFEGEHLDSNLSISSYGFENGDLIDVQLN